MKTRVKNLGEGRQEIVRLLSLDALDKTSMDDPLTYERSIVWLEDISQLPYVRSKTVRGVRTRRGPLYLSGEGRVVGYSKLTPNAPYDPSTNGYVRRVFYLLPTDERPDDACGGRMSPSIVDPRTVFPGVSGERPAAHGNGSLSRFETPESQTETLTGRFTPSAESLPTE